MLCRMKEEHFDYFGLLVRRGLTQNSFLSFSTLEVSGFIGTSSLFNQLRKVVTPGTLVF